MNASKPENTTFSPIPEILDELRAGRPIVLVDHEDRENEGDLVFAAEKTTPELVNFMIKEGRGLVCLAIENELADALELAPQAKHNTASLGTAFTVSVDAREGTTTGVSASDRSRTIAKVIDPDCRPDDLLRPGHLHPLRAKPGGVLVRPGQTEGSVDLSRLAGLHPSGVICEIINDDGTMARVPDLEVFNAKHGLKMCSVDQIIRYRIEQGDANVEHVVAVKMPIEEGHFDAHLYRARYDDIEHVALTLGIAPNAGETPTTFPPVDEPVLVRIHSECLTGDTFGSLRCDCGAQKTLALEKIAEAGRGALIYLRQEGRGIGLTNKLKAYALQERGYDTVEANEQLGLPVDGRNYATGSEMLHRLGIRKVRLLTNNPRKAAALKAHGIDVVEIVPLQVPANLQNLKYLRTKKTKLGHHLNDELLG